MSWISKTYKALTLKNEGHLLWVTLNRPDSANAIDIDMIDELTTVLKVADQDSNIRVILLTGAGKCFCAGGDVKAMETKSGMFAGESDELRRRYEFGIQQIPLTIDALQTPIIAVVNGPAIGAGNDLSVMCDLRIASENAKFGETFARLGLVPGDGGTYFLTRAIGYAKAMEMFLTAKVYTASEALEMGLIQQLVAHEDLINKAQELGESIALNAPISISMGKKSLKAAYHYDLKTNLDLLSAYQGISQRTSDHFEGIQALKEKRNPEFKNL